MAKRQLSLTPATPKPGKSSGVKGTLGKISKGGWVAIVVAGIVLLVLMDMGHKSSHANYDDPYKVDWTGTVLPAAGLLIVGILILRRVL